MVLQQACFEKLLKRFYLDIKVPFKTTVQANTALCMLMCWGVTVPWLAGFPAPVAGLADAGGLFVAGLPSS